MYVLLVVVLMFPLGIFSSQLKHTNNATQDTQRDAANSKNSSPIGQQVTAEECKRQCESQTKNPRDSAVLWGFTRSDLISLALALITATYVCITYGMFKHVGKQAHLMKGQLAEMKNSRRETIAEMKSAGEQTSKTIGQLETQLGHLQALADAAQTSADAAKLTAERLAQIEGSRIIPTVDWPLRPSVTNLGSFEEGKLISRTGISVSVKCKNEGKITSWITEKRLGVGIFDHIPENPDFENIDIIFHGLQEVPKEETFKTDESRVCDESDDAGSMTMIVIWGIVKYRDIFSDSRYSTFGYLVTIDRKLR